MMQGKKQSCAFLPTIWVTMTKEARQIQGGGGGVVGGGGGGVPENFLLHIWTFWGPFPENFLKILKDSLKKRKFKDFVSQISKVSS